VLINQVDDEAMGAGELSITLSPAAIGNAIFGATASAFAKSLLLRARAGGAKSENLSQLSVA